MNLSLTWIRKPAAARPPVVRSDARPRRDATTARTTAASPWWAAWLPRSTAAGAEAPPTWFQQ